MPSGIQIHGKRIRSRRDSITAKVMAANPRKARSSDTTAALQLCPRSAKKIAGAGAWIDAQPTIKNPAKEQAPQKT